jgi:mRNA-degrading endonuclease RelE of RelBE toxin-antitoxin system
VVYRIVLTREAQAHFVALGASQRAILRDQLLVQLSQEPARETKRRKRLRPNFLATWRLRVGDLRVYYEIIEGREATVLVKAIGLKVRERILIDGEEIDLS